MNKMGPISIVTESFKITLYERQDYNKDSDLKLETNHFIVLVKEKEYFLLGKDSSGKKFKKNIGKTPSLKHMISHLDAMNKNLDNKKKETALYELLLDILEVLGYDKPYFELEVEHYNSYAWLQRGRAFYNSAKILSRNWAEFTSARKRRRKKIKNNINQSEAEGTDIIVIILYSFAIEHILKSRIMFSYQETISKLRNNLEHARVKKLKLWFEKNFYTHDIKKLVSIAGCNRIKAKDECDSITYLIEHGKYPSPKRMQVVEMILEEYNATKHIKKGKTVAGTEMFDYFDEKVMDFVTKCYGRNFKDSFNLWMHPADLKQLVSFGIKNSTRIKDRKRFISYIS